MTDERGVVLFVCTGNTCRSPLAKALWDILQDDWTATSAGVQAWPGMPAADEAQVVAREYGADLSQHRSRPIAAVSEAVWRVYTMTARQKAMTLERRPDWTGRVELLTEAVGETGDISDPIGASVQVYRGLAERLLALEKKLLVRLRTTLKCDEAEKPPKQGGADIFDADPGAGWQD